jgi:ribosomal protein S18 acetylase RimI-like enzyme
MGSIILAHDDESESNSVVGFGCAIPLPKAPQDVQDFLHQRQLDGSLPKDFAPAKTWYMSELGVLTSYRERGLAYQLVRHRLISINHAGGTHYVMRTAATKSLSRHLYERLGAQPVTVEQDVSSSEQVTKNGSKSTKRVYLYGKTSDALRWIDGRGL